MEDTDRLICASEIEKGRLYFVTLREGDHPEESANTLYFCTDEDYVYDNFYCDFGPLNISVLYRYCTDLRSKFRDKLLLKKKLVHYTSCNQEKRLNAAFLVGAYAVIYMKKTPDEIYKILTNGYIPEYLHFRDASNNNSSYEISLLNCWNAIYKAIKYNFFNFNDFNADEYEYYERVENGDFNWILPNKFLAFCGPHSRSAIVNGYPQHSPENYFKYFRLTGVKNIIRLNCKAYDASAFTENGFRHEDMFFPDGSCPSDAIMHRFLLFSENATGAIAVHCKAGLGRTGSLIGAYLIKHYKFNALEAIAWCRLCRPGSVIGHQQKWLEEKQDHLWAEGDKYRKRHGLITPHIHSYGIYSDEQHIAAPVRRPKKYQDIGIKDRLRRISNRVDNINLNEQSDVNRNLITNLNNENLPSSSSSTSLTPSLTAPATLVSSVTKSVTKESSALLPTLSATITTTATSTNGNIEQTQGDKLNEIKASRRRHSRSVIFDASDISSRMHTRAKSQPFRNNANLTNSNLVTTGPSRYKTKDRMPAYETVVNKKPSSSIIAKSCLHRDIDEQNLLKRNKRSMAVTLGDKSDTMASKVSRRTGQTVSLIPRRSLLTISPSKRAGKISITTTVTTVTTTSTSSTTRAAAILTSTAISTSQALTKFCHTPSTNHNLIYHNNYLHDLSSETKNKKCIKISNYKNINTFATNTY